ncbi:hypothetical protein [Brevibacillus porteri]|uniref:hypothetical protein n=1 Tax=Brevibacillus porteri TaxID=2126350 RepID=UPI00363897E5
MNKKLDENEIYIIQNALVHAGDLLKSVYQAGYLNDQLKSIDKKLNAQLKDLEKQ